MVLAWCLRSWFFSLRALFIFLCGGRVDLDLLPATPRLLCRHPSLAVREHQSQRVYQEIQFVSVQMVDRLWPVSTTTEQIFSGPLGADQWATSANGTQACPRLPI